MVIKPGRVLVSFCKFICLWSVCKPNAVPVLKNSFILALTFLSYFLSFKKRINVRQNLTVILNRKPLEMEVLKVFLSYGKYWAQLADINKMWNTSSKSIYGVFPPSEKFFIGLTFHFGNFEFFGPAYHYYVQQDLTVIAESLKPHFLAAFFANCRERHYMKTIWHKNIRDIRKVLISQKPLGVVCDRVIDGQGIETRLFGRRVKMPLMLIRNALEKKIPLYFSYCLYDKKNIKIFSERINEQLTFESAVEKIIEIMEAAIRAAPFEWHMFDSL
jgi:lauroyl/myristoyl acyltransferase